MDGEAGVGYILREGYDLPPLMFNRDEMAALVIGARIVRAWGGARMALAAEEALSKIEAVLPEDTRDKARQTPVFAFDQQLPDHLKRNLDLLNTAILERTATRLQYVDLAGEAHEDEYLSPEELDRVLDALAAEEAERCPPE